jgi:2-polyprenyl-3-methyl-5-hydroxy-6-metoxy-1,4-benzoquinol methylase
MSEDLQYSWFNANQTCSNVYTLPHLVKQIQALYNHQPIRIADIGCGNGYIDAELARQGHTVIGLDSSADGIHIAQAAYPEASFKIAS